jgi:hypothetical protein
MCHCVDLVWTDILEEHTASIFRVEKSVCKEPVWAGGDGGDTFLRHIGSYKLYTAPHTRWHSAKYLLFPTTQQFFKGYTNEC